MCCKNTKENKNNTNKQEKIIVKISKTKINKFAYDSIIDNFTDTLKYKSNYSLDYDGTPNLIYCNKNSKKGYFLVKFYSKSLESTDNWIKKEETYENDIIISKKYIFKNLEDYIQIAFSISTEYFNNYENDCPLSADKHFVNIYKRVGLAKWKYIKSFNNNMYWNQFIQDESYDIGKKIAIKNY